MTREMLDADRTYYVRSDALYTDAPGRLDSPAGACKTWQQAVELVKTLDFAGHTVTIQHGSEGAHTFTSNVSVPTLTGGGALAFKGQSTPGNTVFDVGGANCFDLTNTLTEIHFQDMKLQNTAANALALIQPAYKTTLIVNSGVIFGAIGASGAHIWVHDAQAQALLLSAAYSITAGGGYHLFCNGGMAFLEASTVTLTGTPAFGGAFVGVTNGGRIQSPVGSGGSFVGAATGKRYDAQGFGMINTFGGGATYFPGNAAGTVAVAGQYA